MEYENKTEKIEWEDNIFKGMIEGTTPTTETNVDGYFQEMIILTSLGQ